MILYNMSYTVARQFAFRRASGVSPTSPVPSAGLALIWPLASTQFSDSRSMASVCISICLSTSSGATSRARSCNSGSLAA